MSRREVDWYRRDTAPGGLSFSSRLGRLLLLSPSARLAWNALTSNGERQVILLELLFVENRAAIMEVRPWVGVSANVRFGRSEAEANLPIPTPTTASIRHEGRFVHNSDADTPEYES
jgi:hypothetical protein